MNMDTNPHKSPDIDPDLDLCLDMGVDPGADTGGHPGIDGAMNLGINPGLNSGMSPGKKTTVTTEMNLDTARGMDRGMISGMNPGLIPPGRVMSGQTSVTNSGPSMVPLGGGNHHAATPVANPKDISFITGDNSSQSSAINAKFQLPGSVSEELGKRIANCRRASEGARRRVVSIAARADVRAGSLPLELKNLKSFLADLEYLTVQYSAFWEGQWPWVYTFIGQVWYPMLFDQFKKIGEEEYKPAKAFMNLTVARALTRFCFHLMWHIDGTEQPERMNVILRQLEIAL